MIQKYIYRHHSQAKENACFFTNLKMKHETENKQEESGSWEASNFNQIQKIEAQS